MSGKYYVWWTSRTGSGTMESSGIESGPHEYMGHAQAAATLARQKDLLPSSIEERGDVWTTYDVREDDGFPEMKKLNI